MLTEFDIKKRIQQEIRTIRTNLLNSDGIDAEVEWEIAEKCSRTWRWMWCANSASPIRNG